MSDHPQTATEASGILEGRGLWLTPEQLAMLEVIGQKDPHVQVLLRGLDQCGRGDIIIALMVQALAAMAQANAHATKMAMDAFSMRPMPPMVIVTTQADKDRIEREFASYPAGRVQVGKDPA